MLALVFAALLPLLPSDQAPPAATDRPQRGPLLPARSFSRLFTLQDVAPPADGANPVVLDGGRVTPRKKIVCGMTVIIVDGGQDPKMAVAPKGGIDIDPRMPRVPKPTCGQK